MALIASYRYRRLSVELDIEEKPKKKSGVRYVGKGTFLSGIPAKNMDSDEWERIPADRRKHALKLGLYKEI
jgi:hypothetical protein